ncbi:MAG: hypothetical protein FWG71_03335 [Synergistaceae bacterium]|nr:hypothetical protein [Synergistaceae bacterium]
MAYETKVLLIALAEIVLNTPGDAGTLRKIYEAIAKMANAEGVILKPYDEAQHAPNGSDK